MSFWSIEIIKVHEGEREDRYNIIWIYIQLGGKTQNENENENEK